MFHFLESVKKTSKITRQGTTGSSSGVAAPVIGPLVKNHLVHDRRSKWPLIAGSAKEIKILLLGSGQSGKSTFLKQMRILHDHSFNTVAECISYRPTINSNLLESVKTILLVMEERRVELTSEETLKLKKQFLEFYAKEYMPHLVYTTQNIPMHLGDIIAGIWRDERLQKFYNRTSDFQVVENARYFMESAKRICCLHYVPTKQDILQSRRQTMAIVEMAFCVKDWVFRMIDVGGQRSQRMKWISLFDNMDCILFFVALSGYNLLLEEDGQTNRMKEALRVFFYLTSSPFLHNVQMMLFLNKTDLFREKLKRYPLNICFQDYSGPNEFGPAIEYVASRFKAHCVKEELYTHYTCSTDTMHIQFVFRAVSDILLKQMIEHIGLN
ncbi:G protein alpha i subunit-like [Tigriopus californicus]|uniref:G protein alpha i subunit-like n=1 Tax=Tigriopus californicus TaxID=6832 RepID=UPI0027DAB4D3|nr:G protein alpha i subunit-like [Tigriopus californicus]